MKQPKKIEVEIDAITRQVAYYRGLFIEIAIQIELAINEVIAFHYCGKNDTLRAEFTALFLSKEGFNLSAKKDVFNHILHTHHQEYYLKNKLLSGSTLKTIVETRNSYAHNMALVSFTEDELKIELGKVGLTTKNKDSKTTTRKPTINYTIRDGSGDIHLGAVYLAKEYLNSILEFNKMVLHLE